MEMARLLPGGGASDNSPLYDIYARYCNAIDTVFNGNATKHPVHDKATEWTFHNDVRIRIANIDIAISLVIHSFRTAQLRREEEEMGLTSYDDILEDD